MIFIFIIFIRPYLYVLLILRPCHYFLSFMPLLRYDIIYYILLLLIIIITPLLSMSFHYFRHYCYAIITITIIATLYYYAFRHYYCLSAAITFSLLMRVTYIHLYKRRYVCYILLCYTHDL